MNAKLASVATIALLFALRGAVAQDADPPGDVGATTGPATTTGAATTTGSVTTATAADDAAATRPSAEVAAMLARLAGDDVAARDEAQRALLDAPGDATPALRAARLASRDPDVRMRLDTLLAERSERALVGPSRVTLKLDDVSVEEALAAFAKATGAQFDDTTLRNNGGPPLPKVSIDIRDASYFRALGELAAATGVRFQPRGDRVLYAIRGNAGVGAGGPFANGIESGAFYVQPLSATYTRNVVYQQNLNGSEPSFTFQMMVTPEPKLRLAGQNVRVDVRRAVDSAGNDLWAGGRNANAYGAEQINVNMQLNYPATPGERIAEISGVLRVAIATRVSSVEVEDLLAAGATSHDVGGGRIELRATPRGDRNAADPNLPQMIDLTATITRGSAPMTIFQQMQTALTQARVTDGEGRPMRVTETNFGGVNNDRLECRFSYTATQPRGMAAGNVARRDGPVRFRCDIPTAFRDLDVPFSVKDLKMP